jgi:MoaA/NifB/PqqE/SkfB family radical SAM enzyme
MDIIKVKTRLRRIRYMLRERGLKYTWNYLFLAATYNNDFIRDILLTKFYPHFVFYPRYIEVEITTRCNLKCAMCEHTYWNEKAIDMTFEQFKRVVDQFPKLSWIGTTGIGSSFLNKDYLKMLEYAKSKSIYIELFDPFHMLNENLINIIVKDALIDRLICSIDGATKETYEKIRVGAKFDRVIDNIRNMVETKRKYKISFPELSFHYIISRDNYFEVPQFVELVHHITGKDNIGIMFSHLLHSFDEIKHMVFEIPKDIREETIRKAKKYGIKLTWGKNAREKKQPIHKCTEWTMPFIFADGTVIPCCAGNEANRRDYQIKYRMGNIFEEPFEKIWNGKIKKLRDAIHEGKCPPPCVDCPGYEIPKTQAI